MRRFRRSPTGSSKGKNALRVETQMEANQGIYRHDAGVWSEGGAIGTGRRRKWLFLRRAYRNGSGVSRDAVPDCLHERCREDPISVIHCERKGSTPFVRKERSGLVECFLKGRHAGYAALEVR